jgi:epoxyqueuosine reductase
MVSSSSIKQHARALGFDLCGIAPAAGFPELQYLRAWLDRGYAGEMTYLARSAARRADVRHVMASARSVIVVAMVYNVDRPYSTEGSDRRRGDIARYGWGDDYHDVLGRRLDALLAWMRRETSMSFEARVYVDTGPVQERVYAQYAGLGWIGKNTCLINPDLGSWLFLGEVICSLSLEPDPPALDRCGTCTLCLEACPTGALVEPWKLDATRCVSYLTIELKTAIPPGLREPLGSHVYGCDICQEVCPWNGLPARSDRAEWQPRPAFDRPPLAELWERSDRDLRQVLRGSAMTRAKITGLRRNIATAIGNSGDPAQADLLENGDSDRSPSLRDPMVKDHMAWAIEKLRRT